LDQFINSWAMGTRNLHKIDSSQSCFWNQSFFEFGAGAPKWTVDSDWVQGFALKWTVYSEQWTVVFCVLRTGYYSFR
jgi:hypothetical protein